MGALSCLLNKGGVLSGWQFNGRGGVGVGVEISQLLFAYDTLVFCEPPLNSWLLIWFEVMSRLRVYLEKSELILMGG